MVKNTQALTNNEIKLLILNGFFEKLNNIKIGPFNLMKKATTKQLIINPDIELSDLNNFTKSNGLGKFDSFVEFIISSYMSGLSDLIKEYIPYPANTKVKILPIISFNPTSEKVIQISI